MSEEAQDGGQLSPQQQYLQKNQQRFEEEYAGDAGPIDELDTDDSGTPDDSVESDAEDDGALAATDTDDDDSDTDDDGSTPDDEDAEEGGFEKRYKDAQAELTRKSQELADIKSEFASQAGEITDARFALQEQTEAVEQVSQFWATMAQNDLQRLQGVNVSTLDQAQYAQWQQQLTAAQHRAGQLNQALAETQKRAQQAKQTAIQRESAIARARLTKVISDFDTVYPEIGKYAVSRGVNPKVFNQITDPGLIEIIHEAMSSNAAGDTIEKLKHKPKAKKPRGKNLRQRDERGRFKQAEQRFRQAKTPAERRQAYLEKEQVRFDSEYRR